jgi:hypothetical protein
MDDDQRPDFTAECAEQRKGDLDCGVLNKATVFPSGIA